MIFDHGLSRPCRTFSCYSILFHHSAESSTGHLKLSSCVRFSFTHHIMLYWSLSYCVRFRSGYLGLPCFSRAGFLAPLTQWRARWWMGLALVGWDGEHTGMQARAPASIILSYRGNISWRVRAPAHVSCTVQCLQDASFGTGFVNYSITYLLN
jgi:hypothetical protein